MWEDDWEDVWDEGEVGGGGGSVKGREGIVYVGNAFLVRIIRMCNF